MQYTAELTLTLSGLYRTKLNQQDFSFLEKTRITHPITSCHVICDDRPFGQSALY